MGAQKSTPTKVATFDGVSIAKVALGDKYTLCITGQVAPSNGLRLSEYRSSIVGLERRRSSIFSGGDLSRLVDETKDNLMITFDDRLNREEYLIHDDEDEEEKEEEKKDDSEKKKDEKKKRRRREL